MLEVVERLNTGIRSVSDSGHFVTLLLAEINAQRRTLRYVNCGHNPALLFHSETGKVTLLNSSCVPIGISSRENCELASVGLTTGDILVFYTDGITEAQNDAGEEFGTERLTAILQNGLSLSAEGLMTTIFTRATDFCSQIGFTDDVTILVVKCNFETA
jgi:phosphoserine phosphatase RsbU/P